MSLVSIALCTYNGDQYLAEQLETLVNQTYGAIEIVVVDDGSTDQTLNILTAYREKYPIIIIYKNETNLGYIKNFEKAISLCNGDYIAFADQDDIWELNKIDILVSAIADSQLIYHNSEFISETGASMDRKMTGIRNFYAGNDPRIFLLENCISGHALMFNKSLLTTFETLDTTIFHDWQLAYFALNNGGITFIDQCLVKYRQHVEASTNILRLDRKDAKNRDAILQIEKEFRRISVFEAYHGNKFQPFLSRLKSLMQSRMGSYFSFSLAFFIFWHRDKLLFIQRKSSLSKINFIIKYAWGLKLKQRLR